jgi:hypothetical protein
MKHYPTFASLISAYMSEGTTDKTKSMLLAEIEREDRNGNSSRRIGSHVYHLLHKLMHSIGPVLSKKIFAFFTEMDGSKLVEEL